LLALAGTTHSATAADMRAPIVGAPVEVWSWTGVYIGGNVGYSWGRSKTDVQVNHNTTSALLHTTNVEQDLRGAVGGGQIGVNWQSGFWVGGFEADVQATRQKGSAAFTCPAGICNTVTALPAASRLVTGTIDQKLSWFGTLRARLGVTVTPSVIAYATGGVAIGSITTDGRLSGFATGGAAVSDGFSTNNNSTKTGWTAGVGLERVWSAMDRTGRVSLHRPRRVTTRLLLVNTPPSGLLFVSRHRQHRAHRAQLQIPWGQGRFDICSAAVGRRH
jgi:outer membrane immunogenic protein